MNTQLLKKLYSIHSPSGKEQNMIRFLRSYIGTLPGDISVSQDRYGNLYVIKGTGENYPLPGQPYRPGGTLPPLQGFQGDRNKGHHFRLFPGQKTV